MGDGQDTVRKLLLIIGTDEGDAIDGSTNADFIEAGAGGDDIDPRGGSDDITAGSGDDEIDGGSDPDPGSDVLRFTDSNSGVEVDLEAETATGEGTDQVVGVEGLEGTDFADTLLGNEADNHINPKGGDDVADGRDGADELTDSDPLGEFPNDADHLIGGDGPDDLYGGGGDDDLEGGGGRDELDPADGEDDVLGGPGNDLLDADDEGFNTPDLDPGPDTYDGGSGTDTIWYRDAWRVELHNNTARPMGSDDPEAVDSVTEFENIRGSVGDDILIGDDEDNVIRGEFGDDELDGRGGTDTLLGGSGNDTCTDGETTDSC